MTKLYIYNPSYSSARRCIYKSKVLVHPKGYAQHGDVFLELREQKRCGVFPVTKVLHFPAFLEGWIKSQVLADMCKMIPLEE